MLYLRIDCANTRGSRARSIHQRGLDARRYRRATTQFPPDSVQRKAILDGGNCWNDGVPPSFREVRVALAVHVNKAPPAHGGGRFVGGNKRARTSDPLLVRQMLSQLSYAPGSFPRRVAGEGYYSIIGLRLSSDFSKSVVAPRLPVLRSTTSATAIRANRAILFFFGKNYTKNLIIESNMIIMIMRPLNEGVGDRNASAMIPTERKTTRRKPAVFPAS